MRILLTGYAGFIGYTLVQQLKEHEVVGLDNFSPLSNYDIKLARTKQLGIADVKQLANGPVQNENGTFYLADLADMAQLNHLFASHQFDLIIHLAALTGVRQSLNNPQAYIDANVKGFVNLLEMAHKHNIKNLIYASSSSVYGNNQEVPYSEKQVTDSPISVYAASKKADELLAHVYAHLYGLNIIGLRFFTVYGPWTRPDMAAYIFMKAIADKQPIDLFNGGKMVRDFTYVGDVVKAISLLIQRFAAGQVKGSDIFNIGNHSPIFVAEYLAAIEAAMGEKAIINNKPIQAGDMPATNADSDKLFQYLGFRPDTKVEEGVKEMVKWFRSYYSSKAGN
ncbi:MAG: NAD-dependent epimerase/dehydratase family protein [Chitinophagales bacterium]